MKRGVLWMLMASVLAAAAPALGKGSSSSGHSHSGSTHHSSATHSHTGHHSSNYAAGVPRDSHGRIKRSEHAKNEFKHGNPCPSTGKSSGACPGYVVDHVVPLKRGGADKPDNMQWQTVEAAKAKDRVE